MSGIKRKFFLYLILLMLVGCVREEVLDELNREYFRPQLVIHGLITPGDSIFITVGRAVSLGDTIQSSKVTDAVVTIANETDKSVQIPLVKETYNAAIYGLSQRLFPIKEGEMYTLSVSHANLNSIRATCSVPPDATPINEVKRLGITKAPDDNSRRYSVLVQWHDTSEHLRRVYFVDDYQMVNPENNRVLSQGTNYTESYTFHHTEEVEDLFSYEHDFLLDGTFYTHIDTVGDTVFYGSETIAVDIHHRIKTYLITPDQHMALYQQSWEIFAGNREALGSDSFIELYRGIIPEYTNIEGGLGVFGAYLRSEPVYLNLP